MIHVIMKSRILIAIATTIIIYIFWSYITLDLMAMLKEIQRAFFESNLSRFGLFSTVLAKSSFEWVAHKIYLEEINLNK